MKPKACILKTEGTNCDVETAHAFAMAGADAEIVHIETLIKKHDPVTDRRVQLGDYDILLIPGGFSHGDYIASGKILALTLSKFLRGEMGEFVKDEKKLVGGICNGFQVLVKAGYLPNIDGSGRQAASLTFNDCHRFRDYWVRMRQPVSSGCIWTKGIDTIDLPIAHGEGKFVADDGLCKALFEKGMVALTYTSLDSFQAAEYPQNPNGSMRGIGGICDPSGRVFGLMPHPERYTSPKNHPLFTLQEILSREYPGGTVESSEFRGERIALYGNLPAEGPGLRIFRNAVEYAAKKNR